MPFTFTPSTGLLDTSAFPDGDTNFRAHMQALLQQLPTYYDGQLDNKVNKTDFTNSLGGNGWRRLPDGTLEQWGSATVSSGGVITFPTTFASTADVYDIKPIPYNTLCKISFTTYSNANFTVLHDAGSAILVFYRALGK